MSKFEKGAVFLGKGGCYHTATIDHDGASPSGKRWFQRIRCYGATREEAEAFRDRVLAALRDPEALENLVNEMGGDWGGEHSSYSRFDWRQEVASGSTQRGYWDWVRAQLEEED